MSPWVKSLAFAALLPLAACEAPAPPVDTTPPDTPEEVQSAMSPAEVLTRASLDLRGHRPSEADLARVTDEPEALEGLIEDYLHDEAFGSRIRDIFAVPYRTRFEFYFHPLEDFGSEIQYQVSVAEEPLKLIEHIATKDLPYDKVINANYTFVNEELAQVWPVRGYKEDKGGWQKVQYRDERPHAGVLSMNGFYFRYTTNEANLARSRANAISRVLLCDNYLLRPIDFPRNIDLTDEEGIANAIEENSACASCHATLDPIASYLFGFGGVEEDPRAVYRPDLEDLWEEYTGKAPAFYGQSGDDVSDLGRQIEEDPRFYACATQHVYEGLMGRQVTPADRDAIAEHARAFEEGGYTLRSLIRSIVADPVYRGEDDGVRPVIERKILTPEILDDAIFDITGYRMTIEGINMLRSDNYGLHILGGGLAGTSGDFPPTTSNVTRALVQGRVAETAAWALVHEMPERAEEVFGELDLDDENPDADAIVRLHSKVLGLRLEADDPEIEESLALWHDLVEKADLEPREAWAGVLSALMRDPRFVMY